MNKLFSAIFSAVVLFAACQKNEIAEPSRDGQVLYATIEDWSSTRTVLDEDNNIRWSEGDQIVGFLNSTLGLKYQVTASSVGQTSASFDEVGSGGLNAGTELDHVIAYYPYSSAVKVAKSGADYALEVALPYEQTYAHESFGNGSFPMVAVSQTNNITFRNVCGGMKLQLKGTAKIATITVEGKNNEKLSGKASVTAYTDASKPSIVMADDASTSAVLNCGSGVQLNQDDATDFIISLPPTVFTKGFTITVTDVNGGAQVIETSKSNTVLRSSLLKMPVVTVEITTTPQEGDYVDEYGINHGQGIEIDGVVWAPVNCGYHATDFKYGKLYQWGRKYGQGYNGVLYDGEGNEVGEYFDAITPSLVSGPVSLLEGESYSNSNFIYSGSNWLSTKNDKLWNLGVDETPIRTEYDPCPEGWRVPTYSELNQLSKHHSTWTIEGGQSGYWYCGSKQYSKDVSQIFLPAAGYTLVPNYRGKGGYYWSSRPGHYYYDVSLLYFDNTTSDLRDYVRSCGFSIRCVKDEAEFVPVVSVTIDKSSLSMEVGKTETISATITPSDANHNTAFWCSDNTKVAVVDQNGNVTAIAEGTANITAMAGMQASTCTVAVTSARVPQEGDYVDEYGINHGQGIEIDGVVWAPVNCGYHATDFKYGKLYQWGRKYGQGYNDSDAVTPTIVNAPISLCEGQSSNNADVFLKNTISPYEWTSVHISNLWNLGTESNPIKTEYDPCPEGWRVPTSTEFKGLIHGKAAWVSYNGQLGYCFRCANDSPELESQVFFPAAGGRYYDASASYRGSYGFYWSSTSYSANGYAYYLHFSNSSGVDVNGYFCTEGSSIRCVRDENKMVEVATITMDKTSLNLQSGEHESIITKITPSDANHNMVYWWSDNPQVACVEDGNVYAISSGEATITAMAGMKTVTCVVIVTESSGNHLCDYVDEYNVNHGSGVKIGETIWAPVNCGYHKDDFKYGKLYQWGRKYGQGYSGNLYDLNNTKIGIYSDASVPLLVDGAIPLHDGQSEINKEIFIRNLSDSYDWHADYNDRLWNLGTEENPVKTEYDPCPEGWRVPTYTEYSELSQCESYWTEEDDITGRWYSLLNPSIAPSTFKVFLPAAGYRSYDYNAFARGSSGDYWTSTPNLETAFRFHFDMYYKSGMHSYRNTYAYAIRCVQDDDDLIKVERVTINQTQLRLSVYDSELLTATIIPSDANHSYAFWYSDNPEVAIVDQNGNVTAIAEGTANITAMAGMQVATCIVTVTSARVPQEGDYVDEYGINHGPGIKIGETVWAPVNCGYHATDFKYGKLYQWGRKYGQGYDGYLYDGNWDQTYSDSTTPTIKRGGVPVTTGNDKSNSNVFYTSISSYSYDWAYPSDDKLWNSGTEDNPVKTEYDPCPNGWRVPTYSELNQLSQNTSSWIVENVQNGYWFCGSQAYSTSVPRIFLPAAGYRGTGDGNANLREYYGNYWSSRTSGNYAVNLDFDSVSMSDAYRANGGSVRCVQESAESEGPVMYIGYLDGALNQQFNLSKDGIKNVYSNVTAEVIEAGINRGIITRMSLEKKGKTQYPSTPEDTISIFLIPYSSSMNVYIDNGIGGIVPFDHPDLHINGERIITLGNTDYKVYGEYESLNVFMENVNVSTAKFYYIQ